jgi:hypothetical protein
MGTSTIVLHMSGVDRADMMLADLKMLGIHGLVVKRQLDGSCYRRLQILCSSLHVAAHCFFVRCHDRSGDDPGVSVRGYRWRSVGFIQANHVGACC